MGLTQATLLKQIFTQKTNDCVLYQGCLISNGIKNIESQRVG